MTSEQNTEKLYIVLSQTGTVLSRLLKTFTHKEFNHSSISPYEDLHLLYSFGRLNAYNPFRAGFTTEGATFGTFKRFSETKVQVIELQVTPDQYQTVCDTIEFMLNSDVTYRYNIIGLFYAAFGKTYNSKNNYYCSEFIAMLLRQAKIPCADSLGVIVHPVDFAIMPQAKTIYRGKLREFDANTLPQATVA